MKNRDILPYRFRIILRACLESRIGKVQDQENYRNKIGMHLQTYRLENVGKKILCKRLDELRNNIGYVVHILIQLNHPVYPLVLLLSKKW
jgi:hypothetical protein